MWAAEGFLPLDSQHRVEGESIMDVAEHYLCELAQRGMVQVQVEELSGKFKSCQLHDLMRDICLSNGKEENFLKIIHFRNGHEPIGSRSSLKAATTAPTRRLSVFADVYVEKYFPPIHEKTSHVRSVLFFNRCTYRITIQDMLKLLCKDFKLLRVLQLDNFWFRLKLSKAIGDLVHLRYLSFQNSDFIEVPSSLSNLKFLQTLDLKVKSINSLTIPDVLWKLDHLRHLYLPLFYKNSHLQLSSLTRLETLKNFDTRVSDFRDLFHLTKLRRKLSAIFSLGWEDLQAIMNYLTRNSNLLCESSFSIYYRFRSEKELHFLRQLVGCDHLRNLDLIGRVTKLPEYHYFSSSLIKLTLRKSELEENPMAILEKIPTLKFLSLNLNVFMGKEMSCSRQGFPQLRTIELREIPGLESGGWKKEP
ncbi:putative disease resistance protein [Forsythia ovata]|uniref:Disease resistance protein n=1 Tax=Forsythia ovata TaxID=205694 RepID=A0ABD1PI16_9LAMI